MYEIEITSSQTFDGISHEFLREVTQQTLELEKVSAAEISIALVDNESIHQLNKQYLEHDYETDVLSFLLDCEPSEFSVPEDENGNVTDQAEHALRGYGKKIEGEVIISIEMAEQMAAEYRWSPSDESVLYLVHGLLHLCGYDDLSDDEQEIMRTREREILKNWNLSPHYVDNPAASENAEFGGDP